MPMLRELAVQNLALIEDVRVALEPGFCALTGETGAGKTLLLEALGLLLGERGSAELLRAGAEELRVVGRFELVSQRLRAAVAQVLGAPEEDEIVLCRRLTRAGRSYGYVNEQPVALTTLRQLGGLLVDVHGQRESQSLLQPAYQLLLLDAFGDLDALRERYAAEAEHVRGLRRRHAELAAARQQRQRELALLRFERDELEAAALRPGELNALVRERETLAHAQALQTFALGAHATLYDDEGAVAERVGKLLREAQGWTEIEPAFEEIARRLDSLTTEARDLAETLHDMAERFEANPARQEAVEERLQLLRRLEAKYGKKVEELIEYQTTLDAQEETLRQQEDDLASVHRELETTFAALRTTAGELSRQRQKVAKTLAAAVQGQLADLGMAEARLDAQLTPIALGDDPTTGEIPAQGLDQFEIMLAANRGEPARPLRKVASGGELSRTMLALKGVLAVHGQMSTFVFDEVDANVGGRLGDVLGEKLAALGRTHQVLCVTHLPQVASYARHQWSIRKIRRGKRTVTKIERLEGADRLEELAHMLRGEARGETTRREAAAMLEAARGHWS
jgi:DNA repair protein RecN (Recombination protein N)